MEKVEREGTDKRETFDGHGNLYIQLKYQRIQISTNKVLLCLDCIGCILEPFEIAAIGKCIALATGHRSVQGWLALKVNSNIIQKMTENREKVRTKADF